MSSNESVTCSNRGTPFSSTVSASYRVIVPVSRPISRSRNPSQSMSAAFGMFCRSENTASPFTSQSVSAASTYEAGPAPPSFR